MLDEYVTGFFCLLSSLWKQLKSHCGGARVGYFDTVLYVHGSCFFSDVEC